MIKIVFIFKNTNPEGVFLIEKFVHIAGYCCFINMKTNYPNS